VLSSRLWRERVEGARAVVHVVYEEDGEEEEEAFKAYMKELEEAGAVVNPVKAEEQLGCVLTVRKKSANNRQTAF
jgi:hypothetical protein